jgi:hypothetical protein
VIARSEERHGGGDLVRAGQRARDRKDAPLVALKTTCSARAESVGLKAGSYGLHGGHARAVPLGAAPRIW